MTPRDVANQEKYEIDFFHLRLSVRWNTVLLPFEQYKFVALLPDEGYVLDERLNEPRPFGTYPEFGGTIARKGTTTLIMDTRSLILGLEAKNGQSLAEDFDVLENALRSELSFDSPEHASFYEILSNALVWTKQDALAVLRKLGVNNLMASRFSEATDLGPAANATLRLVPTSGEVHSENWWEFQIEFSPRSPHNCYRVQIIYRSPERSKVMDLTKDIERFIRTSIELLEETDE
jgi:hypothetical protein